MANKYAKKSNRAATVPAKRTNGGVSTKALIWTIVAVAAVIGLFLLLRPASSPTGVINVDENGVLKAQRAGVRVIDVRSTGEYEAGHVAGAENVPIDQFAQTSQSWDKSSPVLVYCATGARSSQAVQILKQEGFKTIYHFAEGLQAWTGSLDTKQTASTAAPTPTARPVMYEFYTDW